MNDELNDFITLGGARPTTTVRQSASECIVVSGSPRYRRDLGLRFGERVDVVVLMPVHPGELWCSHCGDWRPTDYFSVDSTRPGKRQRYCKACRNEMRRQQYRELVGGEVRGYTRRIG